ncbi:MAG: hypothetical protein ACRD16_08285 [Thermoanaerobaculia bacterium]
MKILRFSLISAGVLLFALASAAAAAEETPPPPAPPASSAEPAPAALSDAQQMLKLKEAGYSEEFLLNKIHREKRAYSLSTDDLVLLRKAGLSETVIDAMLRSGSPAPSGGAPAAAPVSEPGIVPAVSTSSTPAAAPSPDAAAASAPARAAPASSAAPAASPAPASADLEADLGAAGQSFDGLVRQKHGFLGIGGSKKKAVGKLVVDKEQVHWYQSVDPEDNFSMFTKNIKEMWLACAPRAGENLCLELCFKTYSGDEWCFRDTGWENGTNRQITAVFDYFQKAFPATFFSKREKKSF